MYSIAKDQRSLLPPLRLESGRESESLELLLSSSDGSELTGSILASGGGGILAGSGPFKSFHFAS